MLAPLPPRVAAAALVAVLLLAGLLPYWGVVHWLPWSGDALKWVGRGSPEVDTWVHWDLLSKHFVGYRPITALSFTLDSRLGDYTAEWYRGTDLAFYLLSGAATFAAYRAVTGDRSALGFLPVLLVFGHPSTEDIVPESACRSYLLATTFGLAGVVALARRGGTAWGSVLGAVLLALGALSNEIAYVLFPLVPWVVAREETDRRRIVLGSLPSALALVALLALRYAVLGELGGYQRRIFAFVKGTTRMWHENKSWEPANILGSAWAHTVDPIAVTGAGPLFGTYGQAAFAVVIAGWVVWIGLVRPWRRRDPVALGLFAGVLGSLAIVVLSQTWFWRQAYAVVLPLGMLVAHALAGPHPARERRVDAVLAGLLTVAVAWNGPLLGGVHKEPYVNAIEGTPLARKVRRLLESVDDGAEVYLAAPMKPNGGHLLRLWGEILARPRTVTFHLLAHLETGAPSATARFQVDKEPEGVRLVLGRGMTMATSKALPESTQDVRTLDVNRLWRPDRESWLIAVGPHDAWAVRATEPPPGTEPFQLPLDDEPGAEPVPAEPPAED
jgi:hypothetical protein